ncbi:MAG TPA: hypothetical protein ENN11_00585, partial [Methanomicrobia archaeon]|nr:hypothetical protein [Methanomicrobia archaeon]
MSVTSAADTDWWDDDYNYRVRIVPADDASPSRATLDLGAMLSELGIGPDGIDTRWMADPSSIHAVADGSMVDFSWDPANGHVVEGFESSLDDWNVSNDIDAVLASDVGT